jgi:hypothetical protein
MLCYSDVSYIVDKAWCSVASVTAFQFTVNSLLKILTQEKLSVPEES